MNPAGNATMQVGVVIVNYQSWQPLSVCLDTLADEGASQLDVVVVDNDSPDDQFDAFRSRYPLVTFVRNPGNPGFAHACNVGARHTDADTLLFLNPDAQFQPKEILGLAGLLKENPRFGILSPALVDADCNREATGEVFPSVLTQLPLGRRLARRFRIDIWARESRGELIACDYVPGCALMIGRELFNTLEGWSEAFWMYCEDVDICWRVREAGLRVGWTPVFTAVHVKGQSSESAEDLSVRCRAEHVRARHILYGRHLTGFNLFCTQMLEASKRLLRLGASGMMNLLTGNKVKKHRIRGRTLRVVLAYYRDCLLGNGVTAKISVEQG